MDELDDILPGLQSKLGELAARPSPWTAASPTAFRATLGGIEYVIRRPGKDTDLLGIDRGAERLANERRRISGSHRPSRRRSRTASSRAS